MKRNLISMFFLLAFLANAEAQVPNEFQFQAVVRNDDGSIASNKPLEVKVIIRKGAADGAAVYEETHVSSTNVAGIVTLRIGTGTNTSRKNIFADIAWNDDTYFLETLVDRGSGYVSMGCQQLLSVPYAQCALTASNVYVQSPDGKTWRIVVANDGSISAEPITSEE